MNPTLLTLGIGGLVIGTVTFAKNTNWFSAALVYFSAALIALSLAGGCS